MPTSAGSAPGRRSGGRARPAPRPPPCCRRRGSPRWRSPRPRPGARARPERSAAPCPCARRASRQPAPRPGIRASRLPQSAPTAGPAPSSTTSRPEARQLAPDPLRAPALAPGRTFDPAQRGERLVQALCRPRGKRVAHGAPLPRDRRCRLRGLLGAPAVLGVVVAAAVTVDRDLALVVLTSWSLSRSRSRDRASAAPTNSRNSGAGRSGRDLNSGWNWEAT